MKFQVRPLLAAATLCGSQFAAATTLGLSVSLTSLDSVVCTGASWDCTETNADISPINFSYSTSFDSAFTGFSSSDWPLSGGRTLHASGSDQSFNPYLTGFDHDRLLAFLPPLNITAEQFAASPGSSAIEYFDVNSAKVVITQADGTITRSDVIGDLFESQQWTASLPSGAWLSTEYAIEFQLFDTRVPMTVADVAIPTPFRSFEDRLAQQLRSGGDIFVSVAYGVFDGENFFRQNDSYLGIAHLTSLDGIAPVPDAPAPLMMLAGMLVVGLRRLRASAKPGRAD